VAGLPVSSSQRAGLISEVESLLSAYPETLRSSPNCLAAAELRTTNSVPYFKKQ